jgi:hypothetical protein
MSRILISLSTLLLLLPTLLSSPILKDPVPLTSPIRSPIDGDYDELDHGEADRARQRAKTEALVGEASGHAQLAERTAEEHERMAEAQAMLGVASERVVGDDDHEDEDDDHEDDDHEDDDHEDDDHEDDAADVTAGNAMLEDSGSARRVAVNVNVNVGNRPVAPAAPAPPPPRPAPVVIPPPPAGLDVKAADWTAAVRAAMGAYNTKDVNVAARITAALIRVRTAKLRIDNTKSAARDELEAAELQRKAARLAKTMGLRKPEGKAYPFFKRLQTDLVVQLQAGQRAEKQQAAALARIRDPAQRRAAEAALASFRERLSTLAMVVHHVDCLLDSNHKKCKGKGGDIPAWVRDAIKARVEAARQRVKKSERDMKKLKGKLAKLKKREDKIKAQVRETDNHAKKLAAKLARGKRAFTAAKKKARAATRDRQMKNKARLGKAKEKARFNRVKRSAFRQIAKHKFASERGRGWGKYSKFAYNTIEAAGLAPKPVVFAPGRSRQYNKILSEYLFLLSVAL